MRCKSQSRLSSPPGSWRRGNNAGWLGPSNDCPLRTDSTSLKWFSTNFLIENSSRNSCSLQFFQLLNTSNTSTTKCSFSICQFFVKQSLFSSELFIPCSNMPNFHCLRINVYDQFTNIIFGKIRSVFRSQDLGFCFCEQLFHCLSNNDPDLTVVSLASRSWRRYSGDASEFLVCTSSISASGNFALSSPRMYTVLTFETWKNELTSSKSSVKFFSKDPRPSTRDFSAILACLAYSWYEFHEDPDFARILLISAVSDLAWIAHLL